MDLDWNAVMAAEGFSTWIRIMVWVGVACAFWVFAMLLRGGFDDMLCAGGFEPTVRIVFADFLALLARSRLCPSKPRT